MLILVILSYFRVATKCKTNLMTPSNLALIFSPALFSYRWVFSFSVLDAVENLSYNWFANCIILIKYWSIADLYIGASRLFLLMK